MPYVQSHAPVTDMVPVRATWLWVAAGVSAALLALSGMAYSAIQTYNELQQAEARASYGWQEVVLQYHRRAELTSSLVALVRMRVPSEPHLPADIEASRAHLAQLVALARDGDHAADLARFQAAQDVLSTQLGRLLMAADRDPDLQASMAYQDIVARVEEAERRLLHARRQHVASRADYHLSLRRFPGNVVGACSGMRQHPAPAGDDVRLF